jgi:presqualene diphosphate phosphatase
MTYGTNYGVDKYSFPSGHSSRAALMSSLLASIVINTLTIEFINLLVIVAILKIWCLMTCMSRLLLARHFLTDVLAGMTVGYFIFIIIFLTVI